MDIINRRPGLTALIAFIAGLILGLVVLGWWLFPVQYTGVDPSGLVPEYQGMYVRNAAELYAFDNNQEKLRTALSGWGGDALACQLAQSSIDQGEQARFVAAAQWLASGAWVWLIGGAGAGGAGPGQFSDSPHHPDDATFCDQRHAAPAAGAGAFPADGRSG